MTIRGAVAFILVSNSGVKNGSVYVHWEKGVANTGSMTMAELQVEMRARHIPHSVAVPFADSVRSAIDGWFKANPGVLEKIVVISSGYRKKAVSQGISGKANVDLWIFDDNPDKEFADREHYFPDVRPREHFPENDGIQRMLQAMENERQRSFFEELNAAFAV